MHKSTLPGGIGIHDNGRLAFARPADDSQGLVSVPSRLRSGTIMLAIMGSLAMTACDEDREVRVFKSVEECAAAVTNGAEYCRNAYETARQAHAAAAREFRTLAECEAAFGEGACMESTASVERDREATAPEQPPVAAVAAASPDPAVTPVSASSAPAAQGQGGGHSQSSGNFWLNYFIVRTLLDNDNHARAPMSGFTASPTGASSAPVQPVVPATGGGYRTLSGQALSAAAFTTGSRFQVSPGLSPAPVRGSVPSVGNPGSTSGPRSSVGNVARTSSSSGRSSGGGGGRG